MDRLERAADQPRREDRGDLIVLHLYGSYREMGRQQVELLGPLARDVYDLNRANWYRLLADIGPVAKLGDSILPRFWMSFWRRHERSGLYDEIQGIADGLGVSASDGWRGVFGVLGGGTTTFVATRTATDAGGAIIGKNTDWPDGYGRRLPVVTHYHPANGDLASVVAGWPLLPLPATGVNEAGFALGFNFFTAHEVLGLGLANWPYRRALQKATTVGKALRMITEVRNRGLSGFVSMADANGDIAMVECTPGDYAVFRPDGDWFALANHARTEKMIPHDQGRFVGSFRRRAAMEEAVRPQLGKINPEIAANILRDRANSPYVNESTVANAGVLNSTVVHPASKTLWHSTTMQPLAPFGEMVPFSVGADVSGTPTLPADPRLGTPEMECEAAVIAELRNAVRLFNEGLFGEAGAIWDRFAENGEPMLEHSRLAWARARVRWALGNLEEADNLLAGLDTDGVPFDVRSHGLVARALIADRLGRRENAIRFYQQTQTYLDAHPDYNDQFTVAPIRAWVSAGLQAPQTKGAIPKTPDLQGVP